MPHLNITTNINTTEKDDFKKIAQRWIQAGNKMQVPKGTSRYHQAKSSLRVVAPQSPLGYLNLVTFLQISRTRFL
jgi:hypothetical protein